MIREVSLKDISDGRTYTENDMVKADTSGCAGCYKCCTGMGSSIMGGICYNRIVEKCRWR